jgi:hypothetical protein
MPGNNRIPAALVKLRQLGQSVNARSALHGHFQRQSRHPGRPDGDDIRPGGNQLQFVRFEPGGGRSGGGAIVGRSDRANPELRLGQSSPRRAPWRARQAEFVDRGEHDEHDEHGQHDGPDGQLDGVTRRWLSALMSTDGPSRVFECRYRNSAWSNGPLFSCRPAAKLE